MTPHKPTGNKGGGIPTARNVDHVAYTVPDLEEAITFFVDVLGCELLYRAGPFEDEGGDWMRTHLSAHPGATLSLAALRCGPNTNIELLEFEVLEQRARPPKNSDVGASHLAFYVDDLEAAIAYPEEQPGVEVLGEATTVTGGLTFDLSNPQGKLIANLMASLAEFEHDLLRERVRSGIAAAKARGQAFGRMKGHRPSDRHAPEVIRLSEEEKLSQRAIAGRLGISKTTVNEILKRHRAESSPVVTPSCGQ